MVGGTDFSALSIFPFYNRFKGYFRLFQDFLICTQGVLKKSGVVCGEPLLTNPKFKSVSIFTIFFEKVKGYTI